MTTLEANKLGFIDGRRGVYARPVQWPPMTEDETYLLAMYDCGFHAGHTEQAFPTTARILTFEEVRP